MPVVTHPRRLLRSLFDAAVAAADPARVLPGHLPERPRGRTLVVGAGKASAAMARAFEGHWPGELSGLVVTRYGHAVPCRRIEVVEAAHPVPDAAGEAAAARMLALVGDLGEDDLVVALISGGGSALLALRAAGVTLAEKQAVSRDLLRSGASIDEMNAVRRHLSAIKRGRLAAAAFPARTVALLISDVPGDDPAVIASGPTVPDPTTTGEAREVGRVMAGVARSAARHGQPAAAPAVLLSGGETTVTVRGEGQGGRNVEFLLALAVALDGAPGIWALAGDTDGIDGAGEAAGAVIGPDTLARARGLGLDARAALARNDAHPFFAALGDQVVTGPTLTNVNDFRAVLVLPEGRSPPDAAMAGHRA